MRVVGQRREPALVAQASGTLLTASARFGETLSAFATDTFIPKGLFRFRSAEAANQHQLDCIAKGLARRALKAAESR